MEIVMNAENIMKPKNKNRDVKDNQFGKEYSENKTDDNLLNLEQWPFTEVGGRIPFYHFALLRVLREDASPAN